MNRHSLITNRVDGDVSPWEPPAGWNVITTPEPHRGYFASEKGAVIHAKKYGVYNEHTRIIRERTPLAGDQFTLITFTPTP